MKNTVLVLKIRDIIIALFIIIGVIVFIPALLIGGKDSGSGNADNKPSEKQETSESEMRIEKDAASELYGREIKVYITKEKKVTEMDMEEYIKGVVAAEMPANFDIEALKAQAVASRTYALSKCINKCSKAEGGDICDSTHCQVYTDKESRMKSWGGENGEKYWQKISEAVESTKGQVMFYDGGLVMKAQYFAVSGGRTESSKDVFGSDEPYLQSVSSEGEENAKKYKTTVSMAIREFVDKSNSAYSEAKLSCDNISSVNILSRTDGGGVASMSLGAANITGTDFRKLYGLNSANFTIKHDASKVYITCFGYGHGVGMSQWGANAMAKSGSGYQDILKHYYMGVDIENLD